MKSIANATFGVNSDMKEAIARCFLQALSTAQDPLVCMLGLHDTLLSGYAALAIAAGLTEEDINKLLRDLLREASLLNQGEDLSPKSVNNIHEGFEIGRHYLADCPEFWNRRSNNK